MNPVHRSRTSVVGIVWAVGALVVVGQVASLQIVNGADASRRAARQQERTIPLAARRGKIVDRHGAVLAISLPAPSFAVDPMKVRDRDRQELVRRVVAQSEKSSNWVRRWLDNRRGLLRFARTTDLETAKEIRSWGYPSIVELADERRHYPLSHLAGQLLGHVRNYHTGGDGLEHRYNTVLTGKAGWVQTLVDAFGDPVPQTVQRRIDPEDGSTIHLTVDATMQAIVAEELAETVAYHNAASGTAIMLDASTGAILAMVNVPRYSPGSYATTSADKRRNRAITDPYEPGSTFKAITVAAALNEGLVSPETPVSVGEGSVTIHGETIRDDHSMGDLLSVSGVICHSSNVGTIRITERLKPSELYRYIRLFGFGAETGVDLSGESKGIVHPPSTWSRRSRATISIGQEISVTSLQLAIAYGALANDGVMMQPYVVSRITAPDGVARNIHTPTEIRRPVSPETAQAMTSMLEGVVDRGTGRQAAIQGISVAGKTGTAQIASSDSRGYESGAYIASFVGYLPDITPRWVLLITVTRPTTNSYYASSVAAPTFRRIMSRILQHTGFAVRDSLSITSTAMVRVPNLSGLSVEDAVRVLERLGINGRTTGEGDLVYVQFPPVGTSMRPGGTVTMLAYRAGEEVLTVPNVVGMAVRQAVAVLNVAGITVQISGEGIVRSQSPPPGRNINRNSQVTLVCLTSG